ncbi:MAG: alkaline phosphatase family protein [Bacteroidota bacterium]
MRCRYFKVLLSLTCCASLLSCHQATTSRHTSTPKVVFIISDGIPGDVIEKLKPPTLMEIAGKEGFTRAYTGGGKGTWSESPTISAVGYNNLITGTWARKHNVWDNNIAAPNYHYHSIFRLAESQKPGLTTAIFSTWLDNRTKLAGEGLAATGYQVIDLELDGLEHDTIRFPHDKGRKYLQRIDSTVTAAAAKAIREQGPDLTWIYTEFSDDMGHMYGDSEQFYQAIYETDRQIGNVWKAIQERKAATGEDWLIIITTDHGRDNKTGQHHGRQSDRERDTWMVTNAKGLNDRFRQTPAVVDIYPTIARHLGLTIPETIANELDGVPLTGPIRVSDLSATREGNKIVVTWKPFVNTGTGEILVTTTDHFMTGGTDGYTKVATVELRNGKFDFEAKESAGFYKIVLVTGRQRVKCRVGAIKSGS